MKTIPKLPVAILLVVFVALFTLPATHLVVDGSKWANLAKWASGLIAMVLFLLGEPLIKGVPKTLADTIEDKPDVSK